MTVHEVDLKRIERKAWTSYFHDGLWDIYGGFMLLALGLSMVTDQSLWLTLMLPGILAPQARKRITTPRIGYVKFSPVRETRTKRSKLIARIVLSVILLLGVVMFLVATMDSMPQWLDTWMKNYFLILFGAMLAAIVGLAAYMVGVTRYYAYAVLVLIAFSVGQLFNTSTGLSVAVAGGLILLTGLVLFIHFLRKYPKPAEEAPNDPTS